MSTDMFFAFDQEYHDIVSNKDSLRKVGEKMLSNIIDDLTLGIIFDIHRKFKTKSFDMNIIGTATVDTNLLPNDDIFGNHNMKKTQECECPNCDRVVAATRFATHLEGCMGNGRVRSRNATRRNANNSNSNNNSNNNSNSNNKERDNSSYATLPSDDEDDVDWNSRDKRRKKKHRKGMKKGKGTPKKCNGKSESLESVNVDVEGDEDEVGIRGEYSHDNSNHSSPSETNGYTRKCDKNKKKSSKRDRSSPNGTLGD